MDEKLHELAEKSRIREEKDIMESKKQIKLVSKFKNSRNYSVVLMITGAGFFIIGAIFAFIHANVNYLRFGYSLILILGLILMLFGLSNFNVSKINVK